MTIFKKNQMLSVFICGVFGCLCFGTSDWLMMYGDTSHTGTLFWLTEGVAAIPSWRNTLAMALSFPGIIFYGIALFGMSDLIIKDNPKRNYKTMTAFSLTPWLCLHLFYVLILYMFSWMNQNGYGDASLEVSEAVYAHFSWLPLVSEVLMVPPFLYWFYLQFSGKTLLPKVGAFVNVLVIYAVLYVVKMLLPDSAFRIGFTNGLMSEAMVLWFLALIVWTIRRKNN